MILPERRHGTEYVIAQGPQVHEIRLLALSAAVFDALIDGVAFYHRSGAMMMANPSMRAVIAAPALCRELDAFRHSLLERAFLRSSIHAREIASREVMHDARRYTLRGMSLDANDSTLGSAFCITIHEWGGALPGEPQLRERFHFTPSEARVAVHIAEGRTNKEIAAALGVSPHTVRHHAEHVFAKMSVDSRTGVAWKLLGG